MESPTISNLSQHIELGLRSKMFESFLKPMGDYDGASEAVICTPMLFGKTPKTTLTTFLVTSIFTSSYI